MNAEACRIIDALGGNSEVARMTKSPATTVHGWRRVGLSSSRLDHLRLAAAREHKEHLIDQAIAAHAVVDTDAEASAETGKSEENSAPQQEAA